MEDQNLDNGHFARILRAFAIQSVPSPAGSSCLTHRGESACHHAFAWPEASCSFGQNESALPSLIAIHPQQLRSLKSSPRYGSGHSPSDPIRADFGTPERHIAKDDGKRGVTPLSQYNKTVRFQKR
jgi:hypothetical protein